MMAHLTERSTSVRTAAFAMSLRIGSVYRPAARARFSANSPWTAAGSLTPSVASRASTATASAVRFTQLCAEPDTLLRLQLIQPDARTVELAEHRIHAGGDA